MRTLPCRLDRSGGAIGAGRGREERPGQGSPPGLRLIDAGGHSGSNDRWFDSYGVKPIAERLVTRPDAQRSGHALDRLVRCESVEGASCRARAQLSAKVLVSHVRWICLITSAPFENTKHSFLKYYFCVYKIVVWPKDPSYSSLGRTETVRSLPWSGGPIRPGGEHAARCRTVTGEGSSRPTPGREAAPGLPPALPGKAGGRIRIGDGVQLRAADRHFGCGKCEASRFPAIRRVPAGREPLRARHDRAG